MADHDHSYKLLFAHPQMVREMLETFVGEEWLTQVDFGTLERVSDGYISDDLRARADDIVWRVRCGSRHVYLLIEFQSRVDTFMAVRVLAYVALLYQDLIRARDIGFGEGLPAVLPVVLHSGSRRWSAAEDVGSLLESAPPSLRKYCPDLRYLLIDEGSYDDEALARHDNLVALLFRLEQCRKYDRVEPLVLQLIQKLKQTQQESLSRAFAVWLDKVVLARLSSEHMTIHTLWEKQAMLSERFDEWEAQFRQDGEVSLLIRLLQHRFGELPDSVRARLHGAGSDELAHWGKRLLDTASLEELFQ